jgi:hypothetical protein
MTYFDLNEPLLPPNPETVGMQDLSGLFKAHLKQARKQARKQSGKHGQATQPLGQYLSQMLSQKVSSQIAQQTAKAMRFASSLALSFTELDQAFLAWGFIALAIFSLAQFSHMSWTSQSLIDAALTGVGIVGTAKLTWRLACNERLRWVVCLWAVLMMGGTIATTYGIFCGVGPILMNLCSMWLGLCALGYLAMGVGLRSRCFSAASLVHAIAIIVLKLHPSSQFLTSGLVMALTLFFFSVVPWDMRAAEAEELCGMKPAVRQN